MTNISSQTANLSPDIINHDVQRFGNIKTMKSPKAQLEKVSREFEAIFVTKMLNTMDKTVNKEDSVFGNDPVEIIKDWVTIAEDGYLTLRIRTIWGTPGRTHFINLLTGTNPDNPYEFELRHDAQGDTCGTTGDALVAFNLNELMRKDSVGQVRIKLKWQSFSGAKSAEFDLRTRSSAEMLCPDGTPFNIRLE